MWFAAMLEQAPGLSDGIPWLRRRARGAPLQRVQAQIGINRILPCPGECRHFVRTSHETVRNAGYGLSLHLFRFELELASAPRWKGGCILLLVTARSFFALNSKNKRGSHVPHLSRSRCDY
jgi:hypothetical protein